MHLGPRLVCIGTLWPHWKGCWCLKFCRFTKQDTPRYRVLGGQNQSKQTKNVRRKAKFSHKFSHF